MISIDRIPIRADERGSVFEPLELREIALQKNVHVVISGPGVVRGNHFHHRGVEIIAVRGPALVRFREGEAIREATVPAGEAYRFTFPPGVPHAIKNTGEEDQVLVAFNTQPHDPEEPDVERDVLIEP